MADSGLALELRRGTGRIAVGTGVRVPLPRMAAVAPSNGMVAGCSQNTPLSFGSIHFGQIIFDVKMQSMNNDLMHRYGWATAALGFLAYRT